MLLRNSIVSALILLTGGCTAPAVPLTASKGSPMGTPTTGSIGLEGGNVVLGALTITIPAGVLAQSTTVTATPISATAPGHRGQALRLEPEGMTFSEPVTITFHYDDADLQGTAPEALLVAYQHSSGVWAVPGEVTLDTSARTVSVKTTHFSDWAMVAGAQLRPPSTSVKVNESVTLSARRCFAAPESSTKVEMELAPLLLGFPCDADEEIAPLPVATSEWSVNGVAGGSGSTGTIAGELAQGRFSAPGSKPSPNSVALSARVDMGKKGKVLVVSNVTINDGSRRLLVRAKYSQPGQLLTAFVTGTVVDEGFQFEMDFPVTDGVLPVKDIMGGTATVLRDTRSGCLQPTISGLWDQLKATRVEITGSYFTVDGVHSVPAITLGVGEGDCAANSRTEAATSTDSGLQMPLPVELFTSESPPAAPVTTTQDGWTLTFTTQP